MFDDHPRIRRNSHFCIACQLAPGCLSCRQASDTLLRLVGFSTRINLLASLRRNNSTRVVPIKDDRNKEHEHRVQEIEVDLIGLQLPLTSTNVLNGTEDRANHDQRTDDVKDDKVGLPWDIDAFAARSGTGGDAVVEYGSDDDEEAEDNDLNEETGDENGLGCVCGLLVIG